jgi:hypothetical protein
MKVIVKPCRCGKTYDLMKIFLNDCTLIMVVFCGSERSRIIEEYSLSLDQQRRVVVFHPGCQNLKGLTGNLIVDNADYILRAVLGKMPIAVSLSGMKE